MLYLPQAALGSLAAGREARHGVNALISVPGALAPANWCQDCMKLLNKWHEE